MSGRRTSLLFLAGVVLAAVGLACGGSGPAGMIGATGPAGSPGTQGPGLIWKDAAGVVIPGSFGFNGLPFGNPMQLSDASGNLWTVNAEDGSAFTIAFVSTAFHYFAAPACAGSAYNYIQPNVLPRVTFGYGGTGTSADPAKVRPDALRVGTIVYQSVKSGATCSTVAGTTVPVLSQGTLDALPTLTRPNLIGNHPAPYHPEFVP